MYIQILLVHMNIKINKPKCKCGQTQNSEGYCDGSHSGN